MAPLETENHTLAMDPSSRDATKGIDQDTEQDGLLTSRES